MGKKIKTLRFKFLREGVPVDYQTVIEEIVGPRIAMLSCYDDNRDCKKEINGIEIESGRAYFNPDADYEIVVKQIKNPERG